MSFLDLQTVLFRPARQFGPFTAQVTIEEVGRDELTITEHPVEQGATISDHAFKRPAELLIRLGWSNSGPSAVLNDLSGLVNVFNNVGAGTFNYVQEIYRQLLQLQESRVPFTIVTGKRSYQNMLIQTLTSPTDQKTENALMITAQCKQVIIVQTQVVASAPAANQVAPQDTGAVQNSGTIQPATTNLQYNPDSASVA